MNKHLETMGLILSKFLLSVIIPMRQIFQKNLIQHSRTKHIEIRHHFLRHHVQKGDIALEFISTEKQLADIFTNLFAKNNFQKFGMSLG